MIQQEDIIKFLRDKNEAVKASEIAAELGLTKAEINSKLYQMEGVVLSKTVTTPHYWSLLPFEDQVLNTLEAWGNEGVSAKDIAKELCVSRGDVNPILYKHDGIRTSHNDEEVPKWCYID